MMKLSPQEFVETYHSFAKQTEEKTGIDARFTLAQAALETGWGEHTPGNMFFGVKARAHVADENKQLLITREVLKTPNADFPEILSITELPSGKYEYKIKDWFRKYESPEESFTDHAHFFLRNNRYAKALEVSDNPYHFAEEVAKAGYATDPKYAQLLKRVIRTIEQHLP